jgi:hypothetical protein
MGINLIGPGACFSTATLIADSVSTTGGSVDSTASLTQVNGVPVNAALEVQSTKGGFLMPRMTTAQRNALTTVVNGMLVFLTDQQSYSVYQNGLWQTSVSSVQGSISLANFLTIYDTPIQLLPPPGNGFAYVITRAGITYNYGSAQLTTGGAVVMQYGNTNHAGGTAATNTVAAASFTGATASTFFVFTTASTILTANWNNAGIYLTCGTADFAVGTGGSFKYFVDYTVVTST